jgi:hypothetical protein
MESEVEKLLAELEQMGIFDVDFPEQLVGSVVFAVKSDERTLSLRRLVGSVAYPEITSRPWFTYKASNREQIYHTQGLEEDVLIDALTRFRDNMAVLINRSLKCRLRLPTGHPENDLFVRDKDEWIKLQRNQEAEPLTANVVSPDAELMKTFNKLVELDVFNPMNGCLPVGQFYVRIFPVAQKLEVYHFQDTASLLASIKPDLQIYSDASKFGMEELENVLKHLLENLTAQIEPRSYKELLAELDGFERNKVVGNHYQPEDNEPSPFGPPVKLATDNPWVVWRRTAHPEYPTDGHAARDALIALLMNEPRRPKIDLETVPFNFETDTHKLSLGWVIHMFYNFGKPWEEVHCIGIARLDQHKRY